MRTEAELEIERRERDLSREQPLGSDDDNGRRAAEYSTARELELARGRIHELELALERQEARRDAELDALHMRLDCAKMLQFGAELAAAEAQTRLANAGRLVAQRAQREHQEAMAKRWGIAPEDTLNLETGAIIRGKKAASNGQATGEALRASD